MAFVDVSQDAPQVWVKNLAEGDPIQITSGDVPAQRPRWSPTSDALPRGTDLAETDVIDDLRHRRRGRQRPTGQGSVRPSRQTAQGSSTGGALAAGERTSLSSLE